MDGAMGGRMVRAAETIVIVKVKLLERWVRNGSFDESNRELSKVVEAQVEFSKGRSQSNELSELVEGCH